jgi:scyllo-inositol 2-dehydrogenase (NADP+)
MVDARTLPWPDGAQQPSLTISCAAGVPLPRHEVRVRAHIGQWPRGDVLIDAEPIPGLPADGALATFAHGLSEHGLITLDADGRAVVALAGDSPAWSDHAFLELLAACVTARVTSSASFGVGLLGFGAIGAAHARAVRETPGLHLVAVCDRDAARAEVAREGDPDVRVLADAHALIDDPEVDIVVISTPPDSHAAWAKSALDAGKHVVVEKPMALTTRECDSLIELAQHRGLALSVYQNRRFDPDYALIRETVRTGGIGEVFHVETFVGGYGHPCNFWHSDAGVSGGALFDWGSHIVDQLLDLVEGEVECVTALNHKRVWHDVTNADHARMTLHFDGGREATFIYSDLAAALKPRWFVLGTRGALTGEWRREAVLSRNAIGTLDEDLLAPADAPPRIKKHSPEGDVTDLAFRETEPHPFHADLSLWLQFGIAPRVRGEQSRRVIAMLEAAEESARMGGLPVKPS